MSRPHATRVPSTNIGRSAAIRPLEGKLAIITGGSRGIGAATARILASKGCSLVLNYTSESSADTTSSLASELESTHDVRVQTVQADLSTSTGPAHIISTAKNHFSHPKTRGFQIHIIINNAGVAGDQKLEDLTVDAFHKMYAVNVLGPILLVQAALPYLPRDRSGRIVNVSSISSTAGIVGQTVYGGSKAALEAMTRTWSRELAERATVNAVNPGPVNTEMFENTSDEYAGLIRPFVQHTPLAAVREGEDAPEMREWEKKIGGRTAYAEEVAAVVAMLCGDESRWCTGSVINANGGMVFTSG
ncbi:MAG: hypothetical protein M1816_007449 [Peltula sp. TS41687]|nr:MAG: hypothetical protein M1816_007449 [Peltula sp. TS41687]